MSVASVARDFESHWHFPNVPVTLIHDSGLSGPVLCWVTVTFPMSKSGLGSQSRSRSEPGVFGSLEPEPIEKKTRSWSRLEKKSGAGAGDAKKLASSSAVREDKKHKEIVL